MPPPSNGKDGVALITGGSRGIGKAIAERLSEDGFDTVTLGRTSGDVQADVGDAESVKAAFDEVREKYGPVLVLVNNAGERQDGLAIRMSADQWSSVIHTNLDGAFYCTRRALDDMLKARWGRIVNISSVVMSVSMTPGVTALQVIPLRAISRAIVRVSESIPALAAP